MPQPAEDMVIRNLIESLERLREDLDRTELWVTALDSFHHPIPDYQPGERHLLKPAPKNHARRGSL
jgi:hypothetical protein